MNNPKPEQQGQKGRKPKMRRLKLRVCNYSHLVHRGELLCHATYLGAVGIGYPGLHEYAAMILLVFVVLELFMGEHE